MNIVHFNCGLGNQIMEYIFMRHLDLIRGEKNILADDMWFEHFYNTHNGFELRKDIFPNIKMNMLKDCFDKDVWRSMVNTFVKSKSTIKIPNIFSDNDVEFTVVADEWFADENKEFRAGFSFSGDSVKITAQEYYDIKLCTPDKNEQLYLYDIVKDVDNVFYLGVWFYEKYGLDIKKEIEHELEFTPLIHEENIKYKENILSQDYSVGLHVRRGDFIRVDRHEPIEKYTKEIVDLIKELEKENIKPSFFIFSDDLDWCKENIENFGFGDCYTEFIEGNNVDCRNYIDMQLMTFCDCLIALKLSSFALSAQMISPKPIKLIKIS